MPVIQLRSSVLHTKGEFCKFICSTSNDMLMILNSELITEVLQHVGGSERKKKTGKEMRPKHGAQQKIIPIHQNRDSGCCCCCCCCCKVGSSRSDSSMQRKSVIPQWAVGDYSAAPSVIVHVRP